MTCRISSTTYVAEIPLLDDTQTTYLPSESLSISIALSYPDTFITSHTITIHIKKKKRLLVCNLYLLY